MEEYSRKVINYGWKKKFLVYSRAIENGYKVVGTKRRKYINMTVKQKKKSDSKRLRYYRREVAETVEIAMMNDDLNSMITLTFANPVTNYDIAVEEWKLFLKRLRYYFPDKDLKYIAVWEYQKERSLKEGITKGGVFHFHALTNLGYIKNSLLEKIWRNGFVKVRKLGSQADRGKSILYCTKYLVKEIIEQLEKGTDTRGKRFIFTSNNLRKPTVEKLETDKHIEDVIFEHMEDIIRDGGFDIQDDNGRTVNHVDFVEYRTNCDDKK